MSNGLIHDGDGDGDGDGDRVVVMHVESYTLQMARGLDVSFLM